MRRVPPRKDMGEAISIEDALSLLTVVFVLFILFLVPLVNIDRMRLVRSQGDSYFSKLAGWIGEHGQEDPGLSYATAFGLDGHRVVEQTDSAHAHWVEVLGADGTLTVIEHKLDNGRFVALVVKGGSEVPAYRFGSLRWSGAEGIWFATSDSVAYGDRPELLSMKQRLRARTLAARGF